MRMSTDMQRYSLENQARAINSYADSHGMNIVRVYEDAGKSGLTMERRPGLSRLLRDINEGHTVFDAVLVLDVSRWGRFQNTDEAAFYEFLCWKSGVRVLYVAELFDNDQSPFSMVFKGLKRVMAAEYSRELSAKTTAGQRHLAGFGYRQGAIPGYGLRRLLVSANGEPKMELREGDRKSLSTDRVILIPGPPDEVRTVRWIYEQYVAGNDCTAIARMLNERGIVTHRGKPWVYGTVKTILDGEKYAGHAVYCRSSKKLAGPLIRNPQSDWVRCDGAYEAVVPLKLSLAVRARREQAKVRHNDEALLDSVRKVYEKHGRLTGNILDTEPRLLSSHGLAARFGGLNNLYKHVGYAPPNHRRYGLVRAWVSAWRRSMTAFASEVMSEGGSIVERDGWILTVDRCWTLSLLIVHAARPPGHMQAWYNHRRPPATDIVVYARAVFGEPGPRDYFILPAALFPAWPSGFYERNGPLIESFRYSSLAVLEDLARQSRKETQLCG
ncbi:MAG TPA: recombinase family protein [Luteibacter sp.]|uniref:recombinase family protein n=1 Tax=Luteibacter sp. TaxID=1886636 RepID=UPI002F3F41E2